MPAAATGARKQQQQQRWLAVALPPPLPLPFATTAASGDDERLGGGDMGAGWAQVDAVAHSNIVASAKAMAWSRDHLILLSSGKAMGHSGGGKI